MTNRIDRINGLVGSIAVKAPCKVATTENITLSGSQTISGVLLTADANPRQRVLVKDQIDPIKNGIYDVNSGEWTRSPDFDGERDAVDGTQVIVNEGVTPFPKTYYLSATNPVSIGTDPLYFIASTDTTLFSEPDYTEADQGVIGNGNTIKSAVDAFGSDYGTILFKNNSGTGTTTYNLTTSETIPLNIKLKFEMGALIDGSGTLTINGGLDASPGQRCFSDSIVVDGSPIVKEIYPEWFNDNLNPGTTDMLPSLTTALGLASGSACKTVILQETSYGISDVLEIPDGVKLIGKGCGQYPRSAYITSDDFISTAKTRIVALALFAGTYVIDVATVAASKYTKQSIGIDGIMIDCAAIAGCGLRVKSVKNSYFKDILVFRPTSIGILEDVLSIADAVTEGNNATQFNLWDQITVWAGNTGTVVGWRQQGNASYNINQCSYRNIQIVHANGTGFDCINADTQAYYRFSTYAFGIGYGAVFHGDDVTSSNFARNTRWYEVMFGGASLGGNTDTAQAGAATTITLASTASSTDDYYNGKQIVITGGTGSGQKRIIEDYNGTTKIATVAAWGTNPDATSEYTIDHGGGCRVKSGINKNSIQHHVFGYESFTNGTVVPVVDPGANITWYGDNMTELQETTAFSNFIVRTSAWDTGSMGSYSFKSRLGTNSVEHVAGLQATCQGAAGSEVVRLDFLTYISGARTSKAYISNGIVVGNPTGADKGAGTLNAVAVYDDNVLLTDYVHDAWLDGSIDIKKYDDFVPDKEEEIISEYGHKTTKKTVRLHNKARIFAENAQDQLDTEKWVTKMKQDRKLPAFPGPEKWKSEGILSIGDMTQRLWETVEVQAVHIAKLHERLKELEKTK